MYSLLALQAKDGNVEAVGRVPSETGDEQATEPYRSTETFEQAFVSDMLKGGGDHGRENPDQRPSATNTNCDKEKDKDKKRTTRPDQEPFEAWERDEMENLLGELRGHLGEIFSIPKLVCDRFIDASISHIPNTILGRRGHREQFPLQR